MEKLALKKELFNQLDEINSELFRLYENRKDAHASLPVIDAKLTCLSRAKERVEKLIRICTDRNKF